MLQPISKWAYRACFKISCQISRTLQHTEEKGRKNTCRRRSGRRSWWRFTGWRPRNRSWGCKRGRPVKVNLFTAPLPRLKQPRQLWHCSVGTPQFFTFKIADFFTLCFTDFYLQRRLAHFFAGREFIVHRLSGVTEPIDDQVVGARPGEVRDDHITGSRLKIVRCLMSPMGGPWTPRVPDTLVSLQHFTLQFKTLKAALRTQGTRKKGKLPVNGHCPFEQSIYYLKKFTALFRG